MAGQDIPSADLNLADVGTIFAGTTRMLWRECQRIGKCVDAVCVDVRGANCHCNRLFQILVVQAVESAQGIETRSAETERLSPKGESPVAEGEAP